MKNEEKTLVIVESPSKSKTINKYLGEKYIITSSMGHIIDLPKSRLAVDVENDFTPEYITIRGKAKILNGLKKMASQVSNILLATDPDREGEAISWHLSNALGPKNKNIKRIVFNEITEPAIKEAVKSPREIDYSLVNAQQARRILDRIVGYNISPLLWKKIKKGLSAGRVQSVALNVICVREKEIDEFNPVEYWSIDIIFKHNGKEFTASFYSYKGEKFKLDNNEAAQKILDELKDKNFIVKGVQKKERKRRASAPYITSRMQQDAAQKLSFTSGKTMMIAQQLYEGVELTGEGPVGLITYLRTDSTRISDSALKSVRDYIAGNYKQEYLPDQPNSYQNKKGAQDAHEAIRPTDVLRTPESIKSNLTKDQYKLYSLIWKRFVASQMTPEVSEVVSIAITAGDIELRATGSRVLFDGFTIVEKNDKSRKSDLPDLKEGDELTATEINPEQHFTSPPPRYNDATLVKFLEESGIGRPSTYASIINTLISRYYITRSGRQLLPTVLGKIVNDIVSVHFPSLVSIGFTADMEEKLDLIEESKFDWVNMLKDFYPPFKQTVDDAETKIETMKGILDEETDIKCEKCGKTMLKKLGKFGFFLACSGFPECRNAKSLPLGKCPKDGCDGDVVKRSSKKGRPFYACTNYPQCDFITRENPSEKSCHKCGKLLFTKNIKGKGQMLHCLNENCDFKVELLDEDIVNGNGNGNSNGNNSNGDKQ
ncbi:MAG: type I DNA topoisomerase [Spirochaetes bacterium]|nr:type I DNA topoisomerase [Spirochaetota bacterium]